MKSNELIRSGTWLLHALAFYVKYECQRIKYESQIKEENLKKKTLQELGARKIFFLAQSKIQERIILCDF